MTHRFRFHVPEDDIWHWFEVGDTGRVMRQISFRGPAGVPVVAVETAELALTRQACGDWGVRLYAVVYGVPSREPVAEPSDALTVQGRDFDLAWGRARSHRQCEVRHDSGPLPVGTRLTGTFTVSPWGPGVTGVFVDVGLPAPGFVDAAVLLRAGCQWPAEGTPAEFEVVDLRVGGSHPQIRLRPTAVPPPAEPWPRPAPR
ncbi:hypothetical protein [Streptomyces lanatus]|uniref:S1 motif domain-containing protein n=1 Tax=Streptomyces lanatus TaxID=66900 RepID=A0ABV1XPT9_9ACTN|nr:hypothetical protein [Streptomyces lanatus]